MLRARSNGSAQRRLALLYGGLFLVMGTIVIVIIYAFASVRTGVQAVAATPSGPVRTVVDPSTIGKLQHSADLARLLTASWFVLAVTAVAATVLGWFAGLGACCGRCARWTPPRARSRPGTSASASS